MSTTYVAAEPYRWPRQREVYRSYVLPVSGSRPADGDV